MSDVSASDRNLFTGDKAVQFADNLASRNTAASIWQVVFALSTLVGIIVLLLLLYNIVDGAFGLVAIESTIPPEDLAIDGVPLDDLTQEQLVAVLQDNISAGRFRVLDREVPFNDLTAENLELEGQSKTELINTLTSRTLPDLIDSIEAEGGPLAERSEDEIVALINEHLIDVEPRGRDDILELIYAEVVEPKVQATYSLTESLLNREAIEAEIAENYPNATIRFESWIDIDFITDPQSADPERAGVRTAILGSLWVIAITILFSFPLGVGSAIYLEEYATDNQINRLIQTNINNLAGVPSIIYGLLGVAVLVRFLNPITSGAIFGAVEDPTTANGRTIISAGVTLGLLILPIIIINSQEAIRAVPNSLRQASYGLGATKWQTIWHHVLPSALPGILTGTILSVSRAIGETAPLVVVGASTFITFDPTGPFSKFTVLPIQIYQWTSRPQDEFRNIAAAAIIVLLFLLLSLNATAIILRNRFTRRL